MASSPTPFQFEGRNVRLVDIDGETWFVATDVARELGYRDAADLVRLLDDDEKGTRNLRTLGGDQQVAIVSEPGVYRAIIQRRANKKHDASLTAKIARFQRFVFHDVLPSIRATGAYNSAPIAPALPDFTNPAVAARSWAEQYEAREAAEKVVAQQTAEIATLVPKGEALDRIATADGSLCVTDAAKTLQVRPNDLFRWLRANGWIYKRPGTNTDIAYQSRLITGVLEHKTKPVPRPDGTEKIATQVRVTPKGLTVLAKMFPGAPTPEVA